MGKLLQAGQMGHCSRNLLERGGFQPYRRRWWCLEQRKTQEEKHMHMYRNFDWSFLMDRRGSSHTTLGIAMIDTKVYYTTGIGLCVLFLSLTKRKRFL